ncbi:hypothetical protein KCU73_g11298, partial [Aureobasidium melanogenum]
MSEHHFEMASAENIATFLLAQDAFPPVAECDGVTIRKWMFAMNTGLARNRIRSKVGEVFRLLYEKA